MEIKEKVFAVLIFVAAVIFATFLVSLFSRKKDIPDRSGEIKALEQLIQSEKEKTTIYRNWKDELNAQLEQKDSMLKTQFKATTIKYEKIPVYINSLSKDSLRAAVQNY